jgi:hypothetical protein
MIMMMLIVYINPQENVDRRSAMNQFIYNYGKVYTTHALSLIPEVSRSILEVTPRYTS